MIFIETLKDYGEDIFRAIKEIKEIKKESILEKMQLELKKDKFDSLNYVDIENIKKDMNVFYNAMYNTPLTDNQLNLLNKTETILEDIINFMKKGDYSRKEVDVFALSYEVTHDYLESIEHKYFTDILYEKAEKEYSQRYDEISSMTGSEAIKCSYEIINKADILMSFEDTSFLTVEQIKKLIKLNDTLSYCYNEWLDSEDSHMEELRYCITSGIDKVQDEEINVDFNNELVIEEDVEL